MLDGPLRELDLPLAGLDALLGGLEGTLAALEGPLDAVLLDTVLKMKLSRFGYVKGSITALLALR